MSLFLSKQASGQKPVVTPTAGHVTGLLYEYVTEANLAAGDIIDLGPVEAGVLPVDSFIVSDDLDSNGTPTITLSLGYLNAAKTDLNGGTYDTFIAASTIGQAGGIARATTPNTYLAGASSSDRRLGLKVVAGAATGVGAGKKIAAVLKVAG